MSTGEAPAAPVAAEKNEERKASTGQAPAEGERPRTTSTGSAEYDETAPQRRRRQSSFSALEKGRSIVIAVDESDDAKFAFDWFLEHVHKANDMIVLVHCPEAPKLPTLSFKSPMAPPVADWKKIMDDVNAKTRKLEEDYEQTCIQMKLKYKVRGESMKNPGEGIVRIAEEEKAEMIIMGTRGVGKMKRAILGSVSDYVVRNALLPVVAVPSIQKRRKSLYGLPSSP